MKHITKKRWLLVTKSQIKTVRGDKEYQAGDISKCCFCREVDHHCSYCILSIPRAGRFLSCFPLIIGRKGHLISRRTTLARLDALQRALETHPLKKVRDMIQKKGGSKW